MSVEQAAGPAAQLRALADDLAQAAYLSPDPAGWFDLLAGFATAADEAADAAQSLASAPQSSPEPRCGKSPASHRFTPCDRPPGHPEGECSWAIGRVKQLARDFESEARRVPALVRENRRLSAAKARAESERDTLRAWKATLDRRGLSRFWRRAAKEAERG